MIEQGITLMVMADATVKSLCAAGGFMGTLPKDQALPSWTYKVISDTSSISLKGRNKLTGQRWQVDVYGSDPASCISLASAVDAVLDTANGTLADVDATVLQLCVRCGKEDFFDDVNRTYRRMLEYELWFAQL